MNALVSSTLLISSSAFTATAAEAIPLARMLPSPLVLNHSRGFGEWPDTISGNQTIMFPVKPGVRDMRLKAVVSDLQSKNPLLTERQPEWGISLRQTDGEELRVSIRSGETDDNGLGTMQAVCATATTPDGRSLTIKAPGHLASSGNRNMATLARIRGEWRLTVAADKVCDLGALPIPEGFTADSVGLFAGQGSKIAIESITFTQEPVPEDLMSRWADPDSLDRHLTRSTDLIEGYWHVFDSTLENDLLRLGGDYMLAIVKDEGRYLIVYLGGAETNRGLWSPGMIKGELQPTAFGGIFDLTWIDACLRPMSHRLKAYTADSSTTLTLEFPYQQSMVRLRRVATCHRP